MNIIQLDTTVNMIKELQKEIKKQTNIPLSYMGEYYNLQVHIDLILKKLQNRKIILEKTDNII
jgi:hypothetical protein